MRNLRMILWLLAALATPSLLRAQRLDALTVGATVRVDRLQPVRGYVRGTYQQRDSVRFVIAALDGANDLIEIPLRDITSIELLTDVAPASAAYRRGAARGFWVGLGISAALLITGSILDSAEDCGDCFISATTLAAGVSVIVLPVSTLIGGARGLAGRERWVSVPMT